MEQLHRTYELLLDLPLAIKQASAYIQRTGISIAQYLHHCRSDDSHLIKLLSKDFNDRGRFKSTLNPIATTWLVSFRQISRDNVLAARYLQYMSYLAEKEIPRSILPDGNSEIEMDEAIGTLKAYAFITERDNNQVYDIHRLVGLVMRNWIAEEEDPEAHLISIIQKLNEIIPIPENENKPLWTKYLPHALRALAFREPENSPDKAAISQLLSRVANCQAVLVKYDEAETMHRQALKLKREVLGTTHHETIKSIVDLGNVLDYQGKYEECEAMRREAIEICSKVFGRKHPNTVKTMNNLTNILVIQRREKEVELILREALDVHVKEFSIRHPDTLEIMNNLGYILRKRGEYEEAEMMHRQVLKIRTEVCGAKHSSTITSMVDLAVTLYMQGKYEEAKANCQQAIDISIDALGIRHVYTIRAMHNFACMLHHQGQYEKAEEISQSSLEIHIEVLGIKHPNTLQSMGTFASIHHSQGRLKEARELYQELLELKKEVLGIKHHSTLQTMHQMAEIRLSQGRCEDIEPLVRV